MQALADTDQLVADNVISADQARIIEARAREAMVTLAINAVLCFGIIAATLGFIFWLADPVSVAVVGLLMLVGGVLTLTKGKEVYGMFGNAAVLIGAGMLLGGASFELIDKYEDIAGWVMLPVGAIVVAVIWLRMRTGALANGFVLGSILLVGLAMHLVGIGILAEQNDVTGIAKSLIFLYAASGLALAGWFTDVRVVTALAIVPFAQALETGTGYFHAAYVFYSPEPTISIIQMTVLIAAGLWLALRTPERTARHARVAVMLAFVVANLCALVGSLWGDVVGETIWGPDRRGDFGGDWEAFRAARDQFRASATQISEGVYSILWAVALAVMIFWAARRNLRGLFNGALTFAAIHAYTQLFESFGDEPLAYVIGGLAAIPLAWGMWRLNQRFPAPEPES